MTAGRVFWPLLVVHAILVQVISYGLRPSLSYAVIELGYGSVWLAVLAAMFALPPLILAVATGRLVDRVGERPSMVIGGAALTGASAVALVASEHLALLIAATALLGIGIIFSMVAEQSAVTGQARRRGMDTVFGVYTFITSLGQGVGPLLLLMPPAPGTLSPPLEPIAAACGVASLVTLAASFGFGSHHRAARAPASETRWPARRLLAIPGMYRALLVSGLILASIDVTLAYLPALAHSRGIAPGWVTAMLAARSIMTMASRINLGSLVRLLGRRKLTVAACAVSALALCGLPLPVPVAVLIGLTAVYGFAAGLGQPMTMVWVTRLTPSGTQGTVLSLRIAGNRLAQTLIPAVSGAAAAVSGVSGVLLLTGATLAVAAWSATAVPDD
ncbi:MFS transporter [Nonomuraea sp. KC401]|uniref:MFS transporter n=1 Tax=Nonomuraea longispora TaxID=1848320 RepID=A0A4R4NQA8_9ACTN|nr:MULTISPECIES: MFS transporter [Nonomuraea]NBE92314.1 MFS transporter [Nonomuraea sp. K271]TDC09322.1 MFS transporter [Nonomuraea longispora]TLF77170.1 MFS transporter [Nonomuraea sp. KC401]